jgi:uncharacterized protein YjbI with pentapeptide repeats
VATVLIALFAVVIVLVLFGGYKFNWDWTGFNRPSKTLWDWLQLLGVLAVPIVVGFGAVWFTIRQGKVADTENKDNQREAALQNYIDKMSELLLEKKLRDSAEEDEVRKVARIRTITVLNQLDARRVGYVFTFLDEAKLLLKSQEQEDNVVSLDEADLRAVNWSQANLIGANLSKAKLIGANLSEALLLFANLSETNLIDANLIGVSLNGAALNGAALWGADLSRAYLGGADLIDANLSNANLGNADLKGADLKGADLSNANLTGATGTTPEQLAKAKSLQGATMPDGSKHE